MGTELPSLEGKPMERGGPGAFSFQFSLDLKKLDMLALEAGRPNKSTVPLMMQQVKVTVTCGLLSGCIFSGLAVAGVKTSSRQLDLAITS
jgi:hypothetical protein